MLASFRASFRDRLPSIAAAIAVQAGLAALLLLSFEAVRHIADEKETILVLPRLARPAPVRAPALRGGAVRPPPAATPPMAGLPAYARPDFQFSTPQGATALRELTHDLDRCRAGNTASPSERLLCSPPAMVLRDPTVLPPDKPVKNQQLWQGDVARRNAPTTLPGGNAFAAALLLLFNPSVFADKRNYTAGPEAPPMDGAEMTRQHALLSDHCLAFDDTTRRNCERDNAALYVVTSGGTLLPANTHHTTDAAFSQALAAVQARKQSLSPKPVLASGANKGGGDDKNTSPGGAGAAAGGGAGPPSGPGR